LGNGFKVQTQTNIAPFNFGPIIVC